jgi:hypothetical protein
MSPKLYANEYIYIYIHFAFFFSTEKRAGLTMTYRIAYQINISATRFPHPGTLPVRSLSIEDLECLEIFDFFNYPRLPPAMTVVPSMYGFTRNVGDPIAASGYSLTTPHLPPSSQI